MKENLSKGPLTETMLLILLSLYEELHGYGVKILIEEKTNGRVILGMGTLYGAIKNLAEKNWIRESSRVDGKINYIITPLGKEQVESEQERLQELQKIIKEVREKDEKN